MENEVNFNIIYRSQKAGQPAPLTNKNIELTDNYILIFDKDYRLIDINRRCWNTVRDKSISKNNLLGKHITFYVPEFKDTNIFKNTISNRPENNIFNDDYMLKSKVNFDSIFCEMNIYSSKECTAIVASDITNLKKTDEKSYIQEQKLAQMTQECSDLKITLDVLMNKIADKMNDMQNVQQQNLEEMILPLIDLLRSSQPTYQQSNIINTLEETLKSLYGNPRRSERLVHSILTEREAQIADFIRMGKTTKEISDILYISTKTVDFHRSNIRKKLNIKNSKDSLRYSLLKLNEHI